MDSGLDELGARRFLYSLGGKEMAEFARLTGKFEPFYDGLHGTKLPMEWPRYGHKPQLHTGAE